MQKHDIKIAINNFSNICRACLVENGELESIYEVIVQHEQKTEQLDLVKIFKRYSNVEVSPTDNKPQRVCKPCITLLCQSYSFFEKCSWSNQVLDSVLCENPTVNLDAKNEVEIEDINLEETNYESKPGRRKITKQEKTYLSKVKDDVFDDNDNSKSKPARKRILKQEKTYFSESEDDAFGDNNDHEDDSDWEPLRDEVKNDSKVKVECEPEKDSEKESEKEEASDEELETEKQPTKKRKIQEAKQPVKRRGRPRKNPSVENKKDNEDTEAIECQNKVLECKICDEFLPNINTAIDHYDEQHAPQMEMDNCILCDKPKTYKKRDNLLYHMGLHSKDSIKCIPCRKYFRNKDSFTNHMKECFKVDRTVAIKLEELIEENESKPDIIKTSSLTAQLSQKVLKETQYDGAFTCQLCHKKLGEIDLVISHYEKDHLEDLQCILCLRTFTKHVPLFHLGLHSKKSHVCRPCRLFFRSKSDYDVHYSKYDHDKSLACKICGKKFTRNYKKNKHMLSHLKEKNYSCNKCGKTFTYKTSLVRHFKMHFGKRFLCSSCGNAYTTKFMLQRHIRIMHTNVDADGKPLPKPPPKPVNLQCEFCGEIFKTKYGYGRHIRRHPEFREFKCKICSFMCDTREQLDVHMENKHNKHTCDVCGKRFPFESELKTHHRKHEDMEMARFRCEVCGKTARTQTQLKVHFRIHTGERPFSCELCGKSFKQTAHLKVHMFQHTGKMPFKCDICEKTFPFQHVMEIHMRTHTGEKPFHCMFCGNAYHDRTTMQKHQKKKHPEMPIEKVSRSEYKMTKLV